MSVTSLKTEIVNKIKGLSGIDQNIVFDFESPKWDGFPVVAVTLKSGMGKFLTTATNERHYIFTIRIYQEIARGNIGGQVAEENLMSIVDTIIQSFDDDIRLNRTDVYTIPPTVSAGWVQGEPIRIIELEVDARDVTPATG